MARRSQNARAAEVRRPSLQIPRSEAEKRIGAQIEKGRQLLKQEITEPSALDTALAERRKWSDYNVDLLKRIVDTDELADDYMPSFGIALLGPSSFREDLEEFYRDTRRYVERLESISGRLELIPESPNIAQQALLGENSNSGEASKKVFVVHGHDEEAKLAVARCIERLGLEAVILHEQANQGRTIIEKFEEYAVVDFAVVLLTPDDVGAAKDKKETLAPRARQNVIFELGFFVGKLGRKRVCALHKGPVEILSDFSGVVWTPMDPGGAWKFSLAREMRAAGLDLDLNKLM